MSAPQEVLSEHPSPMPNQLTPHLISQLSMTLCFKHIPQFVWWLYCVALPVNSIRIGTCFNLICIFTHRQYPKNMYRLDSEAFPFVCWCYLVAKSCPTLLQANILFFFNSKFFFSLNFLPHHRACGLLVPSPGIEPKSPVLEAQSRNHWATGKSWYWLFLTKISTSFAVNSPVPPLTAYTEAWNPVSRPCK